ncbi:hypothetical protein GCM10011571_22510 [Marinithermofilum abyssi]|uniref:Tetratricopeptide repeat protein n=1 Tax=Marinithermofilum abyssi TaxID=1571185 RepID=A0A8J2YDT8_9BACL|nr:tetratricopeptide repeat protein [Marinithermofilum abyssi]GGE20058.1 hypothetical protein GCM10011571_22510 [Marinithermofilum abyssi]
MAGSGTMEKESLHSSVESGQGERLHAGTEDRLEKVWRKRTKGHYEEALSAVEEFLESCPKHADGMLMKAQILEEMGRLDESRSTYENVLKIHPDYSRGYREYGRFMLMNEHSLAQAENQLLNGLAINPQDPFAHALLAEVYIQTNRKQQALLHLEIAARFTTEDIRYYEVCARALVKLESKHEKVKHLQRLLVSDFPNRSARSKFHRVLRAHRKDRFRLVFRRMWT